MIRRGLRRYAVAFFYREKKYRQYFQSAMFGLLVADALGVPFEFKSRETFKVTDMTGFGMHNQPAGIW